MERGAWTDERLDDRFDQIDRRFDQVDRRLDRLDLEMREGFAELRAEIRDLRSTMFRLYGANLIVMAGIFAALIARGG